MRARGTSQFLLKLFTDTAIAQTKQLTPLSQWALTNSHTEGSRSRRCVVSAVGGFAEEEWEGRFKAQCGSMPRKLASALPVTPRHPHTHAENKPSCLISRVARRATFDIIIPSANLHHHARYHRHVVVHSSRADYPETRFAFTTYIGVMQSARCTINKTLVFSHTTRAHYQ